MNLTSEKNNDIINFAFLFEKPTNVLLVEDGKHNWFKIVDVDDFETSRTITIERSI